MQSGDDRLWPGREVIGALAGLAFAVFAGLLFLVSPLAAAFSAILFFAMAMITLSDLRHFIIPDVLSLPAVPLGLLANAMLAGEGGRITSVVEGLAGAVIGAGTFYLLRGAYRRLRGIEGLGLGDVKLAAVAGAWLGPAALAPACLAATLAALLGVMLTGILGGQGKLTARARVPFGSFIAPVIFLFWIGQLLGFDHFWW